MGAFLTRLRTATAVVRYAWRHPANSGRRGRALAPGDQPTERGGESAYARTALSFPDHSIGFALVDGHYRDYSATFILPKIKPAWSGADGQRIGRTRRLCGGNGQRRSLGCAE